jgi:hypothetical protein
MKSKVRKYKIASLRSQGLIFDLFARSSYLEGDRIVSIVAAQRGEMFALFGA